MRKSVTLEGAYLREALKHTSDVFTQEARGASCKVLRKAANRAGAALNEAVVEHEHEVRVPIGARSFLADAGLGGRKVVSRREVGDLVVRARARASAACRRS